jgi:curli biogenesis system outer membrane secretion channel CsgG
MRAQRPSPAWIVLLLIGVAAVRPVAAQEHPNSADAGGDALPPPAAMASAPLPKGRASLAVLPLEAGNGRADAADLEAFERALLRAFVQSNKFDVVERARIAAVIAENRFAVSAVGDPSNAAQFGHLAGAQYLVLGRVEDFSTSRRFGTIPYVDERTCRESSRLRISLSVVQSQTGRIVATATAPDGANATLAGSCGRARSAVWETLANRAAEGLVADVIDGIYPLQVVYAGADEVTLNRGQGSPLRVGTRLECFSSGEAIVDPDTGDVLGHDEQAIGNVVVTKVMPKLSKARPEGGAIVPVRAVCRAAAAPTPAPKAAAKTKPRPKVNW